MSVRVVAKTERRLSLSIVAIAKPPPARGLAASFLTQLVTRGLAEPVFGAPRKPSSESAKGLAAPREGTLPSAPSSALSRVFVAKAYSEADARELLERFQSDDGIEDAYVAPPRSLCASRAADARARGSNKPPDLSSRWDLRLIRHDEASAKKLIPDASDVTVAIVDSGVDAGHPDLKDAIWKAEPFNTKDAVDHLGHGTHVAGIIGGRGQTPRGIQGVSNARLYCLKALDPYDPLSYYRALGAAMAEANVINLSLSGREEDLTETQIISEAVRTRVVVAAMGNEFEVDNATAYPACLPGVIAVGAVDRDGTRAAVSNTGQHIALVAPGVDILSTVPRKKAKLCHRAVYDLMTGTSMAAPFVAGAAALVVAKDPTATPSQVKARLKGRLVGVMAVGDEYGQGLLDLVASL